MRGRPRETTRRPQGFRPRDDTGTTAEVRMNLPTMALLLVSPFSTAAGSQAPAEVAVVKGVAYYTGKDADKERHQLDLYLPKGRKDFRVLPFAHRGGWKHGNKEQCDFL